VAGELGCWLPRHFFFNLGAEKVPTHSIVRKLLGRGSGFVLVLVLALGLSACNQELTPLVPTDMAFSLYGHLDVTADTQWIRVAPLRSTIFSTPDPVDAEVTLEDLGTGNTIELVPTLFTQRSGNFDDTLYAYNFRTTELIDPGATYRFTARRSDGGAAYSQVVIPPDHSQLPVILGSPRRTSTHLHYIRFHVLPGAHVAMVQTRIITWSPELICPIYVDYQYLPPLPPIEVGGDIQVNLSLPTGRRIPEHCIVLRQEIRVIFSGEAWPFDPSANNSHINAVDNIENGVGFLGGVQTLTIPWPGGCSLGPGEADFCETVYDPSETGRNNSLFVTTVNGSPPGSEEVFAPRVRFFWRMDTDTAYVDGTDVAPPGSDTPIFRIRGFGSGTYRLRAFGGAAFYCEDRQVDLVPGDQTFEITLIPKAAVPNEPVNANGCREG
jgi:hypothetical protein